MNVLTPVLSGFLFSFCVCLIVYEEDGKRNWLTFIFCTTCGVRNLDVCYEAMSIVNSKDSITYQERNVIHFVIKLLLNCLHPFLCWRFNLLSKNSVCPSTGASFHGTECSIVHFNGLQSHTRFERWICLLPSSLLRASVRDNSLPMSH